MNITYSSKGDSAFFEVRSKNDTSFALLEQWREVYDSRGYKTHRLSYNYEFMTFMLSDAYSYDAIGNNIETITYYRDSSIGYVKNEFDSDGRLIRNAKGLIPGAEALQYRERTERTATYTYHDPDKWGNYRVKVCTGEWKGSVDSTFRVIEYYP